MATVEPQNAGTQRRRRLADSSRARIQSFSDFLNGIALNLQAIGFFGFVAAAVFTDTIPEAKLWPGFALAIVCFLASWVLHFWSAAVLKDLDK